MASASDSNGYALSSSMRFADVAVRPTWESLPTGKRKRATLKRVMGSASRLPSVPAADWTRASLRAVTAETKRRHRWSMAGESM